MAILLKESLDLCGFLSSERFHVAAIRDGKIQPAVFTNTPTGVEACKTWLEERLDHNLYLCGNPVQESFEGKRPSNKDIATQRIMLVDIDPVGANSDPIATGELVYGFVYDIASLIDSGRGCQVWVKVDGLTPEQCRQLGLGLEAKFGNDAVKFDHLFDAARLMRIPGSINHKTGATAEILYTGEGSCVDFDALMKGLPKVEEAPKAVAPIQAASTALEMGFVKGDAKVTWDSDPPDKEHGGRSARDCKFVLEVIRNGANEPQARALLWALPQGKAAGESGRADYYWGTVIAWVRTQLEADEQRRLLALSVPLKSRDDPGFPFERKALEALQWTKANHLADWHRIRAGLKENRKVPLRQLEEAIANGGDAGEAPDTDAIARYATSRGKAVGWFYRADGNWIAVPSSDLRSFLRGHGCDVDSGIRDRMAEPWEMVSIPFRDEEMKDRKWNRDAPRLKFEPKKGQHPAWDMILKNIGASINEAARAAGYVDGATYLKTWIGSLIQFPYQPTAYLFMHGEQGGGKSLLHEALRPLFTRGAIIANNALVNAQGFNGELARSILCVVEEIDLSDGRKTAYSRVKMWVTGKEISVHEKHCTPHDLPNNTHWIQCGQTLNHCPALPGDTRVTVIRVDVVEDQIPKEELLEKLLEEGPAFLHTVTTMEIPPSKGRLRVPALETADKADHLKANKTELEVYIEDNPTDSVEKPEEIFINEFLEERGVRSSWDRERALREFPAELRSLRRFAAEVRALSPWEGRSSDLEARVKELQGPRRIGRALSKLAKMVKWIQPIGHRADGEYWRVNV